MMEALQSHDYSFGTVVQSLLVPDETRVGQEVVSLAVHCSLHQETSPSQSLKEVHHRLHNLVIVVAVRKQSSLTHFLSHDVVVCQELGSCELGGVGGGGGGGGGIRHRYDIRSTTRSPVEQLGSILYRAIERG